MSLTVPESMDSGKNLCPDLRAGDKCFRVQRYNEGKFDQLFHEHVPSHRLSLESELEVLRGLAGYYAGWEGTFILHSRLNSRPGGPSRYPVLMHHVSYPEGGVIRRTVSAGSASAWSDAVLSRENFRQHATGSEPQER